MAQPDADPVDLAAAAIAAVVTQQLAVLIARALRKLQVRPVLSPLDPTAAERQRRHRERQRKGD